MLIINLLTGPKNGQTQVKVAAVQVVFSTALSACGASLNSCACCACRLAAALLEAKGIARRTIPAIL